MEAVATKPFVSISSRSSYKQSFELLIELVKKDLKAKYKNVFLSVLWTALQPLTLALIFTHIRNMGTYNYTIYKLDYAAMYVVLTTWYFFATSLLRGTNSIYFSYNLISTRKFPIILLPLSVVVSSFFDVLINLILFLILLFFLKGTLIFNILTFFLILFIASIFILGLSILFALLQCFMQETNQVVLFLNKLSLFVLPILYNPSSIPKNIREIYEYIPVVWMITKTKTLVSSTCGLAFGAVELLVLLVGILTLFVSYITYKSVKDIILDHL